MIYRGLSVEDVYFRAHMDFVRQWIKSNMDYWERYGHLPPSVEKKCKKVTGYGSAEFTKRAKEISQTEKISKGRDLRNV